MDQDSEQGSQLFPAIALHASAVVAPGGALLFLGHAETGKSTIARLLAGRFPVLADDAVYVAQQEDGSWQVTSADLLAFAGPHPLRSASMRGAGGLADREWTPLQAIIRIFQAPRARLVSIGPRATCCHLADAAFEIAWQQQGAENVRKAFSAVAEIARRYPGWELSFTLDPATCELVTEHFA